jgi:hypothetical protein
MAMILALEPNLWIWNAPWEDEIELQVEWGISDIFCSLHLEI